LALERPPKFEALNWEDVKLRNWTKKITAYLGLEGEYTIEAS
jgi:hypothetical protein